MVSAAEQLAANLKFSTFAKADELKQRLLFTLGALLIYRLGTFIPIPGIDTAHLAKLFENNPNTVFGMLNVFSGGALSRSAIFLLNIMPYITASIIIQLLDVGGADARNASKGRRVGPETDQPIHALSHGGDRDGAGDIDRARAEQLRARTRAGSSSSRPLFLSSAARCSSCGLASRSPRAALATARR